MSFKGGPGQKVQKVMVQPINLIFRYLQNRARIQVWLYENVHLRIEGHIIGFDEYMNLVLDDAEEIYTKPKYRKQVGRILLKGENITLIMSTQNMWMGTKCLVGCVQEISVFCISISCTSSGWH